MNLIWDNLYLASESKHNKVLHSFQPYHHRSPHLQTECQSIQFAQGSSGGEKVNLKKESEVKSYFSNNSANNGRLATTLYCMIVN